MSIEEWDGYDEPVAQPGYTYASNQPLSPVWQVISEAGLMVNKPRYEALEAHLQSSPEGLKLIEAIRSNTELADYAGRLLTPYLAEMPGSDVQPTAQPEVLKALDDAVRFAAEKLK